MIPKHCSCLQVKDYLPYFGSKLTARTQPECSMTAVWGHLFQRQGLFPTPTGRHALWYFLERVDLQAGDEVLIAAYNFYVIVRLVVQKGLVPVFVDIDPETLCLDATDLAQKVTDRSRLVIVTHMFGNPANLTEIGAVCRQHELLLFEDCAHGVGTLWETEQVGQAGDGALFSFGVEKLINTFGGGMLVLSDHLAAGYGPPPHPVSKLTSFMDTFGRCIRSVLTAPRLYGWTLYPATRLGERALPQLREWIIPAKDDPDYRFASQSRAPFKPFMKQMQALQLARLAENISRRRDIMRQIKTRLSHVAEIAFLDEDKHGRSNGSYFGIVVPDPAALARHLARHGIGSNPQEYYDCAALAQFSAYRTPCTHAGYTSDHLLRLPSYPWLRAAEIEHIGHTIEAFWHG